MTEYDLVGIKVCNSSGALFINYWIENGSGSKHQCQDTCITIIYDVPPHPDLILQWEINTEWTEILKTSNKGLQGMSSCINAWPQSYYSTHL